jgi:hypothetical protein
MSHEQFLNHPAVEKIKEHSEESEIPRPVVSIGELETIVEGDSELHELLGYVVEACFNYTETVINFKIEFSKTKGKITDEMGGIDTLRKSVHDSTIAYINAFSRALVRKSKDNSWMQDGGMDGKNRAAYGRFAITLAMSIVLGNSM